MKIKFKQDFPTNLCDIKKDDIFEVVLKKEPDKFMNYVRYQIKIDPNVIVNIPEMFVEEVREIA